MLTASLAILAAVSALKLETDKTFLILALIWFLLAIGIGTYSRLSRACAR
jgi:hypothetical protein